MKTTITKQLFALLFAATMLVTTAYAQTNSALDDHVLYYMQHNNVPGVSLALIRDGKIALTKGYGKADIDKDIPFTPNSIMSEVASISKTITATAIMQLWEQGLFQLNDPVNNYLPFTVSNPNFPSVLITFFMLLNHTSSIVNNDFDLPYQSPGTATPLGVFLQSFLVPGGSLYNASVNYSNFVPGTQYSYSNIGYALLGYLVERISGMPFDEYCNQNIFEPLCMNHTSWYFSGVNTDLVARPYEHNSQNTLYDLYENLDYPCRQLKTTPVDLSRFLLMHMNYGILDGTRIIDSTTEALMRVPQITAANTPDYRLDHTLGFFEPYWYNNHTTYLGHDGNDNGVGTGMFANLTDGTGIIFFQNVNVLFPAFFPLYFYLDSLVDTMSTAGVAALTCSYLLNPCEHSSTYWKNNSSQWALNAIPMKLGTKHYYTFSQTLDVYNLPVNGDASRVLAKSLIAAKLNVAQGSELAPIYSTLSQAMNIIGTKRYPFDVPVSFSSASGIQMLALAATLDSYNSGAMNLTACSGSSAKEIADADGDLPFEYLITHSPNPVSGSTTISFTLPQSEKVSVEIYDVNGRMIATIADDVFAKGRNYVVWNATDVNSGVYFLQMHTAENSEMEKLVVTK